MVYIEHVLVNDYDPDESGTLTAIKVTDPANGTLTLNSDGTFHYTPDTDFTGDDTFTYQAHDGANYSNVALVTIHVVGVNLEIGHGQNDGTQFLSEIDEENPGAVTVANLNDTDGDGFADFFDTVVKRYTTLAPNQVAQPGPNIVLDVVSVDGFIAGQKAYITDASPTWDRVHIIDVDAANSQITISGNLHRTYNSPILDHGGRDEVDLMPLRINPPTFIDPAVPNMTLTVAGSSAEQVQLWENPWKEVAVPVVNGTLTIPVAGVGTGITYWVEVAQKSTSVQDISITLSYADASDTVRATGMWSSVTTEHDTKAAGTVLAQYPKLNLPEHEPVKAKLTEFGGTGLRPIDEQIGVANVIVFAFSIQPLGVQNLKDSAGEYVVSLAAR